MWWYLPVPMGGWEGASPVPVEYWPNKAGWDEDEGGGENKLVPRVWPTKKRKKKKKKKRPDQIKFLQLALVIYYATYCTGKSGY